MEIVFRRGPVSPNFLALLGLTNTLVQGRQEVADQFLWRSAHNESGSIHSVDLPGFLQFALIALENTHLFQLAGGDQRILQPGRFFANEWGIFDTIRCSWEQDFD